MTVSTARTLFLCCAISISLASAQSSAPATIRMVDLNGDGELDLFEGMTDGTLVVSLNLGNRYFEAIEQELPNAMVTDLISGDLNDDGFTDLYLVTSRANQALAGDGTGLFVDATLELGLRDEGLGQSAMLRDLDGDGRADLVLANQTGDVLFWSVPGGFERDARTPFVPAPVAITRLAVEHASPKLKTGSKNSGSASGSTHNIPRSGTDESVAKLLSVVAIDPAESRLSQPGDSSSNPPASGSSVNAQFASPLPIGSAGVGHHSQACLTLRQRRILELLSIVDLSDGLGGAVRTLRVSGANFQVVNGLGLTESLNGLGNLIVGYNELGHPAGDNRTGSHNIVGGNKNNFTSAGGHIVGERNTISSEWASVSGGLRNTASGKFSSVSGGSGGTASGSLSSISGGVSNKAYGVYSSISGGRESTAFGNYSSISGGRLNTASGVASTVIGGSANVSSGYSSVSGGILNTASGKYSSVTAGIANTASGQNSTISGGDLNLASGGGSSISGGKGNTAFGVVSSISGANYSISSGAFSSVSGGRENTASGDRSSVSGGRFNTASGDYSSVSGGIGGLADEYGSSISGGRSNTASGPYAGVSGGAFNVAFGTATSVSGGQSNTAFGGYSFMGALYAGGSVSGGLRNTANGRYASVSGGYLNVADGYASSVSGGEANKATGGALLGTNFKPGGSVSGGRLNTASGDYSSVSGGSYRSAIGSDDWVAGSLFEDN